MSLQKMQLGHRRGAGRAPAPLSPSDKGSVCRPDPQTCLPGPTGPERPGMGPGLSSDLREEAVGSGETLGVE